MIALVLFLAGVGLCITRHKVWGGICLFFALLAVIQ
jgi:hypothetical protein